MFRSSIVMLGAIVLVLSVPTKVLAEDINVTVNRGQIIADDTDGTLVSSPTGYKIFADSTRGSSNEVINLFADNGTFLPGEKLSYEAVSTLKYWNGDAWEAANPRTPAIKITDSSGNITLISSANITNPFGTIGIAGLEGGINGQLAHEFDSRGHRDPGGAYLFELELSSRESSSSASSPYLHSDPFYYVFNNTLTTEDFSKSIDALVLASPVPEPESYAMLLAGLALCNLMVRRRRNAN